MPRNVKLWPQIWKTCRQRFSLVGKTSVPDINRYRRGLKTCRQAKTSKSGQAIFFSFFPTRPSDEYDSAPSRKYSRPLLDSKIWTFSKISYYLKIKSGSRPIQRNLPVAVLKSALTWQNVQLCPNLTIFKITRSTILSLRSGKAQVIFKQTTRTTW